MGDILLGLTVLTSLMRQGDTMTCDDIADVCDCSRQTIIATEKRAKAKVKVIIEQLGIKGDLL